MGHGSPPLPPPPPFRQQGTACMPDFTPASTSAQEGHGLPVTPQQMTAHHRSSVRMPHIRIPRRPSPSPPSSSYSSPSSDDPLAPTPSNLTRGLHPRHTHHPSLPPRHSKTSPGSFHSDQANERPSSTSAASSKLCMHQRVPSAQCPIGNQLKDVLDSSPIIPFKRRRTTDLHCEEGATVTMDDIYVAKEDDRKLVMWRAACAMAHAYLHRQDHHQPDLHQGNRLESSSLTSGSHHVERDEALENKRFQVNRHVSQQEIPNMRWQTEHIDTPRPSSGSSTTSSKDGVSMPSFLYPPSDVVCIDEVVNPTQAAEWFGAFFSSTSTLVS